MKPFLYAYSRGLFVIVLLISLFLAGCEDFLEPDDPLAQLPNQEVYEDRTTATAAVTSLYAKLRDEVLITGKTSGLSFLMGIYADELQYYGITGDPTGNFYNHQILPTNEVVESLWNQAYEVVYLSNAVLDGLEATKQLPSETKTRLQGEALFVRAFVHFYLMNLYGDVPYIKTTDYPTNSNVRRMETEEIYTHLFSDLTEARNLLEGSIPHEEKTRPDHWTVTALMARVHLYQEEWEKAEAESSLLIEQSPFTLSADVSTVFLKESAETLWQLHPKYGGDNTQEAATFHIESGPPQLVALSSGLMAELETEDLRRQNWVGEVSNGNTTWYFSTKYKEHQNTGVSAEYSIVFRLAEQYLIRAEARARQGNTADAKEDLNVIRQRAGLPVTTAGTQETLLEAIFFERRIELFTEHGQRWFDLRRTDRADQALGSLKPGWKVTNTHLPLPQGELLMNPNLKPQNPGY